MFFLIIIFSFFLFAPGPPGAKAADTIDKGRNITDGNTLVSAGRSFTLGFFSPAGVPTKRYLGIWFSVSPDTVYWVANRDHPLNDTSGVLMMSDSGSLLLLDGSGSTTFDHPCNNMLPGMKIGKNRWTGTEWSLSSWRSASDPAPGYFRYITSAVGIPENVLWDTNNTKVYRTGPWNGKRFNGVPEMEQFAENFTFQLTDNPDSEVTYGYFAKAGAAYSRVTVTETGRVQRLVWEDNRRAWKSFSDAPRDHCDYYAKCGPFGLCDPDAMATSICGCVQGFSPMSSSEWSIREYSHGCKRNVALDCTNQSRASTDDFAVLHGVKLPDTDGATVDKIISLDQCKARCLANCSCVAYAAADLTAGGDGTGCIVWTNSFVDVRLIDQGQDFYLRLAKSEIRRAPARQPGLTIPSIDYQIIKAATEDFSRRNLIGQGNFGSVYEAVLPDNESTMIGIPVQEKVAVKVLKQSDMNSYKRELDLMSRLSHVNLVRLLAACCSHEIDDDNEGREETILVLIYEYMKKGSLDHYVFGSDKNKRAELSWTQRLQTISSIAEGVLYLHVTCGREIIHRDLKPANILLADDWKPKIADFGLAKHITDPAAVHTPFGPHFGVMLLEIISGRENGIMQEVLPHAWNAWTDKGCNLQKLLDPKVPPSQNEVDPMLLARLERCIQIGLLCVQESPDKRPSISQVVAMLNSEASLQKPEGPTLREEDETSNARKAHR
ncbi:Receptor-like serine/threonine-protein kinase SD1-8 [Dichanthelium oligosanthes]|uniref:non-specific serine/threonine protein kinase n=1 Tax=Dichanthelium oligosanthes TaxID=888268 RepID=A0A1E5WE45_9POAL|nr:Receptor-like serine/threonine-protein kinase SD1-8 [Dichanthelium oligosanthes]